MYRKNRILGLTIGSTRAVCAFALVSGGLLLVGCGQKGPLFHPGGGAPAPVTTPYSSETPPLPEEVVLPR
ncbi:lipoprotein [Hydrogenophaga sp.]|uniref:LPS translocon maturation chaperone LptM n=1 Tax=Hydrogenophaga sp. TaxID=1904254 RepID=UPI00351EB602